MTVGDIQIQSKLFRLVGLDCTLGVTRLLGLGARVLGHSLDSGLLGVTCRSCDMLLLGGIFLVIAIAEAEGIVLRDRGGLDCGQRLPFACLVAG